VDLLSLARIESGDEIMTPQAVQLQRAMATCRERLRERADARRQTIELNGTDKLCEAWVDEEALTQILDNLVDNAVKYTPEGGLIDISWKADEETVQFSVRDNGIGIPAQDLLRIFERFYRVDKARSRELGGTGLGLAIVKHMVQSQRGTITATSEIGKGTCFTITLPRA
jgi:two-component system phosphate regulon sensor histidine kinase PhoR